ncbi:unnamed protein product, partial [Linum tenue]
LTAAVDAPEYHSVDLYLNQVDLTRQLFGIEFRAQHLDLRTCETMMHDERLHHDLGELMKVLKATQEKLVVSQKQ